MSQTPVFEEIKNVVIRFAGDSGDGMQLTGTQFSNISAVYGNDISTLPDFPAEIRAPAGTLAGVSGFQVNLSSEDVLTPGDTPHVLVAMNPAALAANIKDLEPGATIIINTDAFTKANLKKANLDTNPLEDGSLKAFRVYQVPLTSMNREALKDMTELSSKDVDRCQNFFALGIVSWVYDRRLDTVLSWIDDKFGARAPAVAAANRRALESGYFFGETSEIFQNRYRVKPAKLPPGVYRKITGNQAFALGLVTAAQKAGKALFYGGYPITPASDILHNLAPLKHFDVRTFQAEDEIAAMGSIIGAAFGGAFAVTATSGPGIALKSEAMNLAMMLELPMVIIDVQRGGPSTGMPTKPEQTDLLQVLFGRNGESPIPVIAPATPADCFHVSIEAFRWAVRAMTPVIILADGFLANSSEPWNIPDPDSIEPIPVEHPPSREPDDPPLRPYVRDIVTLGRPWAIPGTRGLEHRIGGLSKEPLTGSVSYDPDDDWQMHMDRQDKILRLQEIIPALEIYGPSSGPLLVLSWGSTYGAARSAVTRAQAEGSSVAHVHIRHMNPLPRDLEEVIRRYKRVLIPELNLGQLTLLVRGRYGVGHVEVLPKVTGRPFTIGEIHRRIKEML